MSRSYKKFPMVKCERSCKYGKKRANKKIRNLRKSGVEIPSGRSYKKLFESCEICDYSFTEFEHWAEEQWYKEEADIINGVRPRLRRYHTSLEEHMADWKKYYKCK